MRKAIIPRLASIVLPGLLVLACALGVLHLNVRAQGSAQDSVNAQFVDAVERLDIPMVKELLAQGANPDSALKLNPQFKTPLHFAIEGRNRELAQILIAAGADINRRRGSGYTPLHTAIGVGQTEIAKMLIERGADISADMFSMGMPLHYAVFHGQPEIAKLLIDKGADVNARAKTEGKAPLHFIEPQYSILPAAYTVRHEQVVQLLLAAGADTSVKDNRGKSVAEVLAARPKPRSTPHPVDEMMRKLDEPKVGQ